MACMHKETFEIFHNDQLIVPDGYVDIDELIAPTIQILNRKGYITVYCCSGHPFSNELCRNPTEIGYQQMKIVGSGSYIAFEDGVKLPSAPPGYKIETYGDSMTIRRFFDVRSLEIFAIARTILDAMEQLYNWAVELPEFTSNT